MPSQLFALSKRLTIPQAIRCEKKCLSCLYTDSSCCAKVRFENLTQWQLLVPRHVPKETGPVRPVVLKVFGKP